MAEQDSLASWIRGRRYGLEIGLGALEKARDIIEADTRISDADKQYIYDDIRKALEETEKC